MSQQRVINASPSSPELMRDREEALPFTSLAGVADLLQAGDVSAETLVQLMLRRVERWNGIVGAYSDILDHRALHDAVASDARRRRGESLGAIDGVPVAVKDLIETTPARCKAGLAHLSEFRPTTDALIVARLRAAGAIIMGVTETDSGAFGTSTLAVVNPHDPKRIAGGSSGGSGAVLAAGLAYAAIGTDTGGSIRIPAACCSVCGFKPTWGQWPLDGIRPLAPSLDHVGPMARSVADLEILHAALSPGHSRQRAPEKADLVIGFPLGYFEDADPLVAWAMAEIAQKLTQAGMDIRPVDFPSAKRAMQVHGVNGLKEIADYHLTHFAGVWETYPEISRRTIELGRTIPVADYEAAKIARAQVAREVEQVLQSVDLVLAPTLPVDAPFRDASEIRFGGSAYSVLEATIRYTALFNQTGHPVVAMPGLALPDGRTIGVQVVGKMHSDAELLSRARLVADILAVTVDYDCLLEDRAVQIGDVRRLIEQGATP